LSLRTIRRLERALTSVHRHEYGSTNRLRLVVLQVAAMVQGSARSRAAADRWLRFVIREHQLLTPETRSLVHGGHGSNEQLPEIAVRWLNEATAE
jgi:hypothetical protein